MFIRHDAERKLTLHRTKKAAGSDFPVYGSEKALAESPIKNSEMAILYAEITGKPLVRFPDKKVAAKLLWAACEEYLSAQGKKVGRPLGTGKFAGKTIYPKCRKNPRRNGVKGWHSYEIILGKTEGVPYEEYVAKGGRPQDLQWDLDRKWVEVK